MQREKKKDLRGKEVQNQYFMTPLQFKIQLFNRDCILFTAVAMLTPPQLWLGRCEATPKPQAREHTAFCKVL